MANPFHTLLNIFLVFKFTTQHLQPIYDQRTTTSNFIDISVQKPLYNNTMNISVDKPLYNDTTNILSVHVAPKIYHGDALVDPCTFRMSVTGEYTT